MVKFDTHIKPIKMVSALITELESGIVAIVDMAQSDTIRHSFATRNLALISALSGENASLMDEFESSMNSDTKSDMTVYDIIDQRVYRLMPHVSDIQCFKIAGIVPPKKSKNLEFNIGESYASVIPLRYKDIRLSEGTQFKVVGREGDRLVAEADLENGSDQKLKIRLSASGELVIRGEKRSLIELPKSHSGYTSESEGYILLCAKQGAVYFEKSLRSAIPYRQGSHKIMPVVQYLCGERVMDIVLLNSSF